ncbi:MAG: T9SS type A sorting domain-containing protein [Bacteroidetes bacterium]|nr:T9SS type A sorting domain-containing protein [Bacteroidota bacterium]
MKLVLLILFSIFWLETYSQITFNERYVFGYPLAIFRSIELLPDSENYLISGLVVDSVTPYRTGAILTIFTEDGSVISGETLVSENQHFENWGTDLFLNENNHWIVTGYGVDTTAQYGQILVFNQQGDTVSTKRIYHPYYPAEQFIRFSGGLIPTASGYFGVMNVFNPFTSPKSNDGYIIVLNEQFETENSILLETPMRDEIQLSAFGRNEKIYIGAWRSNQNLTNQNYTSQLYIQVRDTAGQLLDWRLYPSNENDFLMGPADAMFVEEDGSVVVATRVGMEEPVNPVSGLLKWKLVLLKFDSSLDNVLWETSLSSGIWHQSSTFSKVIKSEDASGYVVAGTDVFVPDGIGGVLAKVSLQGDSLWLRRFQFVTSTGHRHAIYDMEQTPDGGYVMVGEARPYNALDPDFPPPIQQGWIIKVDEFGCLVPGCQTVSTKEAIQLEAQLTVYPNPVSDHLNVFFHREQRGNDLWQFRLIDAMGQTHSNFQTRLPEMTFIVDVQPLASGIYFLEAVGPDGQQVVEEVVVGK